MTSMLKAIACSTIYVLDQDEALAFYVGNLGLEVTADVDLGFMRWLTVNVPGDPGRQILLARPGPPAMDEATVEQVREPVTKGATAGGLFFVTDDCKTTYDALLARVSTFSTSRRSGPMESTAVAGTRLATVFGLRQLAPIPKAAT